MPTSTSLCATLLHSRSYSSSAVKGVVRRHVPDFLLITEAGPLVVDVKPKNKLAEATVADTLAWTRAAIESRGWSYEVWGEPLAVELNNLRFLSGFRRDNSSDKSWSRNFATRIWTTSALV